MVNKFTPSVNIIRDAEKSLRYISTPNAERVVQEIGNDYRSGIHSFTIIGSYGTGKSSFLMALERSLSGEKIFNVDLGFKVKSLATVRVVGNYQSLIEYFTDTLGIEDDFSSNQKIFDALHQLSKKSNLLLIYLDEFGKFLEYATQHNPERELYFLQQLAEFVNDHNREILLITTLHQNFEAYASNVVLDTHKKEWRKVKGRFKELTFNEPIEQLLFLAAQQLQGKGNYTNRLELAKEHAVLPFVSDAIDKVASQLSPLDIISASVLTKALQSYGQNERSLFTFLESDLKNETWASIPVIYDYLLNAFYSYINSGYNVHYRNWQGIQNAIERAEISNAKFVDIQLDLIKTLGLLQLFASKAAKVDDVFLIQYFSGTHDAEDLKQALSNLEKKSIIRFAKYNNSYKIIEGTDLDFDLELIRAEESIDRTFDLASALREHFEFPVIQAKEVSYKTGTPRLFGFEITDFPLEGVQTKPGLDGVINLIFNSDLKIKEVNELSAQYDGAQLYGFFTNSKSIQDYLFEILKTKKALADNQEDHVAKQEFEKIVASHERLLSHEVLGSLYSDKVRWFFRGTEITGLNNPKRFNAFLSKICGTVFNLAPRFNNELMNKEKISSSIHTARKLYFQQLTEYWHTEEFGFEKDKFPPEKSIYKSLIVDNEMHTLIEGKWELTAPSEKNGFDKIWKVCETFLESSHDERRNLLDLWSTLSRPPYKLKLGLVDFWIPTYLFIRRGDFALYEGDKFIPYINDSTLYMLARQPELFQVKAFEISGLRLKVFNKYREFLDQSTDARLKQESFIESVRPFLVFYKNLNDYSKKTNRLSQEAIALRRAIVDAQDPEKTFFEAIPAALQIDLKSIGESDKQLSDFAVKLNDTIEEIKGAYSALLDRVEQFILDEILGKKLTFEGYKSLLSKRYKDIKEHRLLAKQKVFVARLNSPIDDRDSWVSSIGQAILGKPLDKIEDNEEDILKDRLAHAIQELDNIQAIHKLKQEEGDSIYKLDITSEIGMISSNVRIPKESQSLVLEVSEKLDSYLGKNKKLRLAILSELIKKEMGQ